MNPKKAILFTHGFMGCNRQFDGIKPHLGAGADLIDHVVDGHGGGIEAFVKSTDFSWQNCYNEHLCRLEREYDEIYLVGHSMGGLLALRGAIARPKKVRGVLAVAFPLKVRPRLSTPNFFRQVSGVRRENEDPRITAARALSGVKMDGAEDFLRVIPNSFRFLRLAKRSVEVLPRLSAPLTVIFSEKDELVSPVVRGIVEEKLPNARVLTMPDAYHFLFGAENEKLIADEILKMTGGHLDEGTFS